jgi:hypothetical protein
MHSVVDTAPSLNVYMGEPQNAAEGQENLEALQGAGGRRCLHAGLA